MKKTRKFSNKLITGAATFVAVAAFCTIGGYAYFTPTDYVSLDVNPSIEYSVNTFDRILDVTAINDDGEEILASLSLENKTIQDALKETIDKLFADGFLTNDPNGGVIITTSNEDMDDAEALAQELQDELQDYIDENDGITAEVQAEAVGAARVEEAKTLGVTPGKLNLVEKLQSSTGDAINVEEWLKMPVKDINKAIKENRELAKDKQKQKDDIDLDDLDDIDDDVDLDNNQYKNDKDLNQIKLEKEKEKITNENKNSNNNSSNETNADAVIVDDQDDDQNFKQEQEKEVKSDTNQNGSDHTDKNKDKSSNGKNNED